MAHDLTRGELKRNELREALGAGVHFAGRHLKAILGAAVAIAAAALLTWGVFGWRAARVEAASERLGRALAVAGAEIVTTGARPDDPVEPSFASRQERDARARDLFRELADDYGSTGAGQGARLWLGQQALAEGDPEEARRRWRQALESGADHAFAAAARLDLAQLDRAEGRSEELIAELEGDLARGGGPLPADALLAEMARTYEALGRGDDARRTWQRLVEEHPQSAYSAAARQQLGGLPTG